MHVIYKKLLILILSVLTFYTDNFAMEKSENDDLKQQEYLDVLREDPLTKIKEMGCFENGRIIGAPVDQLRLLAWHSPDNKNIL